MRGNVFVDHLLPAFLWLGGFQPLGLPAGLKPAQTLLVHDPVPVRYDVDAIHRLDHAEPFVGVQGEAHGGEGFVHDARDDLLVQRHLGLLASRAQHEPAAGVLPAHKGDQLEPNGDHGVGLRHGLDDLHTGVIEEIEMEFHPCELHRAAPSVSEGTTPNLSSTDSA